MGVEEEDYGLAAEEIRNRHIEIYARRAQCGLPLFDDQVEVFAQHMVLVDGDNQFLDTPNRLPDFDMAIKAQANPRVNDSANSDVSLFPSSINPSTKPI